MYQLQIAERFLGVRINPTVNALKIRHEDGKDDYQLESKARIFERAVLKEMKLHKIRKKND